MAKKKVSVKDFDLNLLPKTRKEQFGDIIKHRYLDFLKAGFFLLLFCVPLIISIVIKDSALLRIDTTSETEAMNMRV